MITYLKFRISRLTGLEVVWGVEGKVIPIKSTGHGDVDAVTAQVRVAWLDYARRSLSQESPGTHFS